MGEDDLAWDDTAAVAFRGHLFHLTLVLLTVFGAHAVFLSLMGWREWKVPRALEFPQVEITLTMVVCLGAMDVSAAVIFSEVAAPLAWRFLAGLEVALCVGFVYWLYTKGRKVRVWFGL